MKWFPSSSWMTEAWEARACGTLSLGICCTSIHTPFVSGMLQSIPAHTQMIKSKEFNKNGCEGQTMRHTSHLVGFAAVAVHTVSAASAGAPGDVTVVEAHGYITSLPTPAGLTLALTVLLALTPSRAIQRTWPNAARRQKHIQAMTSTSQPMHREGIWGRSHVRLRLTHR